MENNYTKHFERELQILRENNEGSEELIIDKFEQVIRDILEINSKQGHSGSSAHFYAAYLSEIIKDAMLMKPLGPITGIDCEWVDVSSYGSDGDSIFQNNRDCAVFKEGKDSKPYYLDAIVWVGEKAGDSFTGKVEELYSRQFIKLPFTPKTFYIDVVKIYMSKDSLKYKDEDCYEDGDKKYIYKIKDRKQLEKVAEYYDM
jgi:hypothetical protein